MVKWRDLEGTGMARMPRRYVVDDGEIGVYHCINRCVRRAFLCGTDEVSGKCFDHRKRFIQSRLEFLAGQFGIDVLAFAVMSNHLHVVVRNRPDVVKEWSDEEVARRWWMLFPKRRDDEGRPEKPRASDLSMITSDADKLAEIRGRLSNIGWFMRCVAEPVARMANREDDCTGRFWEGRYKCQPLLDEAALTACMAYVDLNPIRAGIAKTPETSEFTSAAERCARQTATSEGQRDRKRGRWLSPIPLAKRHAGKPEATPRFRASHRGCLSMSEADYLTLLDWSGRLLRRGASGRIPDSLPPLLSRLGVTEESWLSLIKDFGRLFHRAAGTPASLTSEAARQNRQWLHGTKNSRATFQSP